LLEQRLGTRYPRRTVGRVHAVSRGNPFYALHLAKALNGRAEGGPLPGLETVLAALPADLHPTAVEGFFTSPDADLDGASPAQWLASGGDPQRVADEVEGLELW